MAKDDVHSFPDMHKEEIGFKLSMGSKNGAR